MLLEEAREFLEPAGEEEISKAAGVQRVAMDGRAGTDDSGGEAVSEGLVEFAF
jgi:hypothetical protein